MEWKGIRGTILENVPMKRYTSMRVGGPVKYLLYPVDEGDLRNILKYLIHKNIPYRFLGNGTNVIVNDKGLNEALIRITKMKRKGYKKTKDGAIADVSGGISLKQFIRDNARHGLSGLENLYWIPGTVGGALKMNAGSFGASVSDPLLTMRVLNAHGHIVTMTRRDTSFGYRTSPIRASECVMNAQFNLKNRDKNEIAKDMAHVYSERKKRHPMEYPSAGSVFKGVEGGSGVEVHREGRVEGTEDRRRWRLGKARKLHRQSRIGNSERRQDTDQHNKEGGLRKDRRVPRRRSGALGF